MNRPPPIGLVADSHQLFGFALAELLERHLGLPTVLSAHSFSEATDLLSAYPAITIAVFDLLLDGLDGLKGISDLRLIYPHLRLVVVAESAARDDILAALAVGVHGYLPRVVTQTEAILALQTIIDGHIYVPAALSEVSRDQLPAPGFAAPGAAARPQLTARQHQVMLLLVQGYTNKQIAEALQLAEGTVKVHVSAVFRALNVHNRTDVEGLIAAREKE